jgi:hypothetical protein
LPANVEEHVGDARLEDVPGHSPKQRPGLHAIVHIDAGGTAANGIDAGQVRGRLLQRVHDAIVVILRIGLVVRVPFRLIAEDDASVDHSGDLAVAATQIEPDAAAVEISSERLRLRTFRRHVARVDDGKLVTEHQLADEVRVESSGLRIAIVGDEVLCQGRRAIDVNAPSTARPENEFDEAFQEKRIGRRLWVGIGQCARVESEDRAVGLLERDANRHAAASSVDKLVVGVHGEHGRAKTWIQHRGYARSDQRNVDRHSQSGPREPGSISAAGQNDIRTSVRVHLTYTFEARTRNFPWLLLSSLPPSGGNVRSARTSG